MDSAEFHAQVVAAVTEGLAKGNHDSNPFEWEGIPEAMHQVMMRVIKEALEATREDHVGAPFHIPCGQFAGRKFTPASEAVVNVEIMPFPNDDERAGANFNLADSILRQAEAGDWGWHLFHIIGALKGTIARLEAEAEKRGWILEA